MKKPRFTVGTVLELTLSRVPVYGTSQTSGRTTTKRVEVVRAYEKNDQPGALAAGWIQVRDKRGNKRLGKLRFGSDGRAFSMRLGTAKYEVESIRVLSTENPTSKRAGGRFIGVRYTFHEPLDYRYRGCAVIQGPDDHDAEWHLTQLLEDGDAPFWPEWVRTKDEIDLGSIEESGDGYWYVMWIDSDDWDEAVKEGTEDDLESSVAAVQVHDKESFRSREAAEEWLEAGGGCPYGGPTYVPYPWQNEVPKPAPRSMQRTKQPKKRNGAALIRKFLKGS